METPLVLLLESTAISNSIPLQGVHVGYMHGRDLYVLDGKIYRIGKRLALNLGDWFEFCAEHRRRLKRGDPRTCTLHHIDEDSHARKGA